MTEQQQPQEYHPDPVPLGRRLPPELAGRMVGDNPYAYAYAPDAGAGGNASPAPGWYHRQGQPPPPPDTPGKLPPQPPPPPPLPPDTPAPESESESEFMGRVIALAYAKGWRIYHTYDSRRSVAGFPDLLMLHPTHGQIVAELKTATGKLTPQQANWLLAFEQAGQKAAIWRPADWDSGLIERWLAGAFAGAGQPQPQDVPDTPAPATARAAGVACTFPDCDPCPCPCPTPCACPCACPTHCACPGGISAVKRPGRTHRQGRAPCWNCGAAPRVTAASMLCAACGGGGVA